MRANSIAKKRGATTTESRIERCLTTEMGSLSVVPTTFYGLVPAATSAAAQNA